MMKVNDKMNSLQLVSIKRNHIEIQLLTLVDILRLEVTRLDIYF